MKPISAFFVCLLVCFGIVLVACKLPILFIGLLVGPVHYRLTWLVEFIYPSAIGRWGHLLLMKWGQRLASNSNDAITKFHSRCSETRIELIPNRLYVHPLPQFLDNLGYLIVIVPSATPSEPPPVQAGDNDNSTVKKPTMTCSPIIGIIVDCGQAEAVLDQIKHIRQNFYNRENIKLHAILSTHKHHDHTAGNHVFVDMVDIIVGGAVERVPCCNTFLADQEKVPLLKSCSDGISITAIAVPSHTRGSLAFALEYHTNTTTGLSLFVGDTMFCGGAGVAFEADLNSSVKTNPKNLTAHTYIQATNAANAVERCFSQVLFYSSKYHRDQVLVFPGHEYSSELLSRQLNLPANSKQHHYPPPRWKTLPPGDFFETAAAWYVADHRKETARLLAVPSTIARELKINPHFRSMQQRAIVILHALRLWHSKFANATVHADRGPYSPLHQQSHEPQNALPPRTESKHNQWNVSVADVQRPIFTTLYSTDLEQVIHDLQANVMDAAMAAERLKTLSNRMNKPVVSRRPVPGTIPSGRAVYRGLLALVLLGSPPSALCASDAAKLNLEEPNDSDSETILIDKTRLIAVLHALGLLDDEDGKQFVAMIHQLWRETNEYKYSVDTNGEQDEVEGNSHDSDHVKLGDLKWVLYGIPCRPSKSFESWCLPCRKAVDDRPQSLHPACRMLRHSGTFVLRFLDTEAWFKRCCIRRTSKARYF
jgi:glyoxylase-like metal-dependent hydrolase (beta-lactamase superfamily II)